MSWRTAQEIAGLPGLPSTQQGVKLRAKKDGWRGRRRSGRGSPIEYSVRDLPVEAQEALALKTLQQTAVETPSKPVEQAPERPLKGWQIEARDARLAFVQEALRLGETMGLLKAERLLSEAAASGELPAHLAEQVERANARRGQRRNLSKETLRLWRARYQKHGADALAPKACPHERTSAPDWLWPLMRYYARPSKPSVRWCMEQVRADGWELPTERTAQREIKKLGAVQRNRGRLGPRELKRLRAYKVRDFSELQAADVYIADGHCIKREVLHPRHGKPFRPEVVHVIDVATRRAVGWSAGLAESAWLVADALRHAGETAVPAIFYTDGGSGFINEYLTTSGYSVLHRMGTWAEKSLPYNSQARGVIERAHRSILDRESRALPGYVGRAMDKEARERVYKATRREIKETGTTRKLPTFEEFLAWLADVFAAYNERPHSGLPKIDDPETGRRRHMTPNEAWARAEAAGAELFCLEGRELDDVFRPYERRVVQRGQVQLHDKTYFHSELERWDLHGQEVQVGYDIHDPERVWIRNGEGQLVCVAELDANKTPFFPKPRVEQAREKRAKGRLQRIEDKRQEVLAELGPETIQARIAPSGRVTEEDRAALKREMLDGDRPREETDRRAIFARALELEERLDAGEPVEDAERRWLESYRTTPEYQTHKEMLADFGPSYLEGYRKRPDEAASSTGRE